MERLFKVSLSMALLVSIASTTVFAKNDTKNFVKAKNLTTKQVIQDQGIRFELLPQSKGFSKNSNAIAVNESIVLGYPTDLLNQGMMFGGSIIKVSDAVNEDFGNLKLSHLTASVVPQLINTTNKIAVVLKGKYWEGKETEASQTIVEIPATKVDATNKMVYLDLSSLGEQLDIAFYLKNFAGESMSDFKHIESKTTSVDFSLGVLVFDVASNYAVSMRKSGTSEAKTHNVTLTTRWFLRLNSLNNPFFEPRKNTEGVGYFTTGTYNPAGEKHGWISRFPIHDLKNNPIKYYVKNVPLEHRPLIAGGIEDWNHKLQDLLGHDLISYEFIDKNDPRNDQIMAGDVRFNVLEWDIDNRASYGGLGPSLKNALTGEVMAAQTLIQGPAILEIYKQWFKVKQDATTLRSNKQADAAKILEDEFLDKLFKIQAKQRARLNAKIKLGALEFVIPSQDPNLKDPMNIDPLDYLQTPAGYSYENYMNGYWREIVAHELGHNLGLRHNFRGNLKDKGEGTVGSASWSVMEYLPRTHRHLNRVGEYDIMAIAYGYLGIMPEHKDRFCTDGDQAIYSFRNSAECSNADATNDPITFFEQRLNRGLDLLLARKSNDAPAWTINEVWGTMSSFFKPYAAYAYSAKTTAHTWTNFFGKAGRPKTADEVPAFIISRLNYFICGAHLDQEVSKKASPEAQAKAKNNLKVYRTVALNLLRSVPSPEAIVTSENFSCLEAATID